MGKLKPRLGSRKKAKRWPKGQSSSSNPEITKHRNQARSRFFQENLGNYKFNIIYTCLRFYIIESKGADLLYYIYTSDNTAFRVL